jgi:hypothetical protein
MNPLRRIAHHTLGVKDLEKERSGTDLVNSPRLGESLGLHEKHRERIQNKLEEFLPAREARDTAAQVYDLALGVDEDISGILKDPLVRWLYEYDGRFFTPRGTQFFHTAFDGLHVLKSLKDSTLETFFHGREKRFAIRWLMEELGKHAWVAKLRRMNWEESGTLSVVPKEVLDAIIKDILERRRQAGEDAPLLSPEEQAFFQSYEEEMRPSHPRQSRR